MDWLACKSSFGSVRCFMVNELQRRGRSGVDVGSRGCREVVMVWTTGALKILCEVLVVLPYEADLHVLLFDRNRFSGIVQGDSPSIFAIMLLLDAFPIRLCYTVDENTCPLRHYRCRSVRRVDAKSEVLTVVASDSE